jgi:pimeloyl-ACP methyl ester carboxylesterase
LYRYKGAPVKVYFIPGIGADHRLFLDLRLPEGYEPAYIHWIPPIKKEPLSDYAFRLIQQIDTTEPFILAGLSLGGIMAVEMAKRIPPACTILISSVPVSADLPRLYRIAGALQLDRLIPASVLKFAAIIKHSIWMRTAAGRRLMRQVIRAGDDRFIRWALNAVLKWQNTIIPQPFYHIHGSRDEVFPMRLTSPTHVFPKGGHMFLISHPEAVNNFLHEVLLPIPAGLSPAGS